MNWFLIGTYAVKQTPSFLNIIIQFGKGIVHLFEHTLTQFSNTVYIVLLNTFEYLIIKGAKF